MDDFMREDPFVIVPHLVDWGTTPILPSLYLTLPLKFSFVYSDTSTFLSLL